MFEKVKKEIDSLKEEIGKELDELYDMQNFLYSLKGVVEFIDGNK